MKTLHKKSVPWLTTLSSHVARHTVVAISTRWMLRASVYLAFSWGGFGELRRGHCLFSRSHFLKRHTSKTTCRNNNWYLRIRINNAIRL